MYKFEVGDIITYKGCSSNKYCNIREVKNNNTELWGFWYSTLEKAIENNFDNNDIMRWVEIEKAILIKKMNKSIKQFGIVKFWEENYV